MADFDNTRITKEMLVKAGECKSSEELMELAKTEGIEITKEEAEAYLGELQEYELDEETLEKIAGGASCYMIDGCAFKCGTLKAC